MNRRDLLRGGLGALAGGTAAVAALSVPDAADAQATAELSIAGDQTRIGPDGSVAAVSLDADIAWRYDLPDSTHPSTVIVELRADDELVADTSIAELFPEASGEASLSAELIADGPLTADGLEPDGGGQRETEVAVEPGSRWRTPAASWWPRIRRAIPPP